MPEYHIQHITRYRYASTVIDCTNQLMLYPIQDPLQQIRDHQINISGHPVVEKFTDYFGNQVGMFSLIQPHNELTIESVFNVTKEPVEMPVDTEEPAKQWQELKESGEIFPYMDFLQQEAFSEEEEMSEVLGRLVSKEKTPLANALALSEFIFDEFEYKKDVTSALTKLDEVWSLKAGVCQDFAHTLLAMLRRIGIPARYVSGYICPKNQELRGEGATHAWVEAYIPFYGWLGLDPTNKCVASDRHVRLAVGRNFSDCTPVKGTYKGSSEHTLEVSVIINNGEYKPAEKEKEPLPSFTYQAKNPAPARNSYRRHLEMQQQQQQQQ